MFKTLYTRYNFCVKKCYYSTSDKIGILGVPFWKGGIKRGAVENGPKVIREGGLITELSKFCEKSSIKDYGDVNYTTNPQLDSNSVPNMHNYLDVVACNQEISKNVEKILRDNRVCVTLGGDHSIAIGTIDGHVKAQKDICILYVDAHADINTNKTSYTGNIHGMPLGLLMTELVDYWPYLPGMDWQKPSVSLKNLAYIGLRSVDPYERIMIDELGICAFDMTDVEEYGITDVVEKALKSIDPENNRSIHVSFDIDALDTLDAPSTVISIPGGLTIREGIQIMEKVHDTGRLRAMDLTEVNPGLGSDQDVIKTVNSAIQLISAACGFKRRGIRPKNINKLPIQVGRGCNK